jgi:hypothetical protein
LNISAESQTGTWAEEKHDEEQAQAPKARPIAVSRKSQRTNTSFSTSPSSPKKQDSIIDENGNTLENLITALGIGWKNIMDNPAVADMARAYARLVENHFPLTDASIMVESEALHAYLVRASEKGIIKFWLFDSDFRWCQLLSNTLQGAVNNIRAGPTPMVEGPIISRRERTPTPPTTAPEPMFDIDMAAEVPLPTQQQGEIDAMQL